MIKLTLFGFYTIFCKVSAESKSAIYEVTTALKQHAQYTFKQMGLDRDAVKQLAEHARENNYVSHRAASSVIGLNSTSSKKIFTNSY